MWWAPASFQALTSLGWYTGQSPLLCARHRHRNSANGSQHYTSFFVKGHKGRWKKIKEKQTEGKWPRGSPSCTRFNRPVLFLLHLYGMGLFSASENANIVKSFGGTPNKRCCYFEICWRSLQRHTSITSTINTVLHDPWISCHSYVVQGNLRNAELTDSFVETEVSPQRHTDLT